MDVSESVNQSDTDLGIISYLVRGFGVSGDIAGPLAKARAFIEESIKKMHGKEAADIFIDAYGKQFYPDTFGKAGKFQERLIESRDEKTGKPVWRPPVEKKQQSLSAG